MEAPESTVTLTTLSPREAPESTVTLTTLSPREAPESTITLTTFSPREVPESTVTLTTFSPREAPESTVTLTTLSPREAPESTVTSPTLSPREAPESTVTLTTARKIQQEYLEAFGCSDWNKFEKNDLFWIKHKIAFALFGAPGEFDKNDKSTDNRLALKWTEDFSKSNENSTFGYTNIQMEQVLPIYEKICALQKYSPDHKSVFMSIIFVCCVPKKDGVDQYAHDNVESDKIYVSPVFRVRKCIKVDSSDNVSGCSIFIDDIGRVYKSWKLYLENNKLPKGFIVAPEKGRYSGILIGDDFYVNLEIELSPASTMMSTVREIGDYACAGVAIGAIGVVGASLITPVAAGVATYTAIATGVTGLYGMATSTTNLKDRSEHEQSISLKDSEARSCWLNLGASATGTVAGASSRLLARAASSGANIAQGFRLAHDTALVMAAVTNGAGLANTITNCVIRYNKTKKGPTPYEVFQIASQCFFLYNTLVSSKMASTIIEETQTSQISNYRETLRSNRHRKIYDKLVAETRRINGKTRGNAEVIKGIQKIENKDQFFQDTLRINKQLNQHQVRISMKDGKALLNGEHIISPEEFYQLNSEARVSYLNRVGPANLSTQNVPTKIGNNFKVLSPVHTLPFNCISTLITLSKLQDSFPDLSTSSNEEILRYIALKMSNFINDMDVYNMFTSILKTLENNLNMYMREQLACLGLYGNDIIYRMFVFTYDFLKTKCGDDSHLSSFLNRMENFEYLKEETIYDLLKYFEKKLFQDYRNSVAFNSETRCNVCNGLTFCKD